jgi:protein-S-isoprenylcysteine O-methyltransferase Ste14
MIRGSLLQIIAYGWLAFGAYWVGINARRRSAGPNDRDATRVFRFAFLAIAFAVLFLLRHKIPPPVLIILSVLWGGLSLYWVSSGQSSHSGEFRFYRPLRLLILATTFALLFWDQTAIGILGRAVLPAGVGLQVLGFVGALVGLAIALWARIHLGNYWSDKVVLRHNHQLIRTGPYAYIRHPIYSGVLLGVLGTALIVDQWRGFVAFALLTANYMIKAKREERILADRFHEEFQQHRSGTGFLLPRFRARIDD